MRHQASNGGELRLECRLGQSRHRSSLLISRGRRSLRSIRLAERVQALAGLAAPRIERFHDGPRRIGIGRAEPLEQHVAIALLARRAAELLEPLLHVLARLARHERLEQAQGGGAAARPDAELMDRFLPVLVLFDALAGNAGRPASELGWPARPRG